MLASFFGTRPYAFTIAAGLTLLVRSRLRGRSCHRLENSAYEPAAANRLTVRQSQKNCIPVFITSSRTTERCRSTAFLHCCS